MKLLVLGAKGMLGRDVVERARAREHVVEACGRADADITQIADIEARIAALRPDWVLNCAAYTQVDRAESERDAAFKVNAEGAGVVARACAAAGCRLLHVSTDYVFDGRSEQPYAEDAPCAPINVYGASKLAGERAIVEAGGASVVARAQSLFGIHGPNFVATMLRLMSEREDGVGVVNDQTMAPTFTAHLAEALLRLIEADARGVVHVAAAGTCTWYEFAREIAAQCAPNARVRPIGTEDYPVPAARPVNSVLDTQRFETLTGWQMPHWKAGLAAYVAAAY